MVARHADRCGTTVQVRGTARTERGLTDREIRATTLPIENPLSVVRGVLLVSRNV